MSLLSADPSRCEGDHSSRARHVFLAGCGLPAAWRGQSQWRILDTCFGLGLNFLVTWAAWKADLLRPKLLHFVALEAWPVNAQKMLEKTADQADLHPLALQLQAQLWGLLPGFHRLVFEGSKVLLTLCIGDIQAMLRQQQFEADSVYLSGFPTPKTLDSWDIHTLKAIARCCSRGTRLASQTIEGSAQNTLKQCGFVIHETQGTATERHNLQAQYNPRWEPKRPPAAIYSCAPKSTTQQPLTAVVVGAGLAGAAIANSLARRGWQVVVLDAASTPASGASSLPAGLLAPHVSPDDAMLSRLSRSGVRMTLQQAHALLVHGIDWGHTGVMAHDMEDASRGATTAQPLAGAAADWSRPATFAQLAGAGLADTSRALWHAAAGWIKPARLVKAWLDAPGIVWRGNAQVATLQPHAAGWQALDAAGSVLAQAHVVVLAAAYESQALAASVNPAPWALQAVRGQVSCGTHSVQQSAQQLVLQPVQQLGQMPTHALLKGLPDFPVNGHGALIPAVPGPEGLTWLMGASYERDCNTPAVKQQDHDQNLERLRHLLPQTSNTLADALTGTFKAGTVQGWAGIRCATPHRLPVLGCIARRSTGSEVWLCTGMGSRGLTFSALCAELLAAQLHGEPLPLEKRLAQALMTSIAVAAHA